ncbi:ATP-binding protein [Runella sp.]|uniref:ATP-binding protein n=1 Tax=Runella sp. TaxID=1960881 RepID=UPI0038F80BAD
MDFSTHFLPASAVRTKPTSEGTGLGLFMCKDIIEIHNGNISIHSQEGQFTEVVITLPVLKETHS